MLDNKYKKWYFKLIESRQNQIPNEVYKEKHHIIPKCLGGSDAKTNLVYLTPKEHFIAHLLLTKMYIGEAQYKMIHAFTMMLVKSKKNKQRICKSSRMYAKLRSEVGKKVGKANKGKIPWNKGIPRDEKIKLAVSLANKGKIPWNKGKIRSEEERNKMIAGWVERKLNGYVPHNKGVQAEKIICPYCKKLIGGRTNFKRWHDTNCKNYEKQI